MPSNPNRDFMQQMRQNDQRFQRFAQQNMKRQQDQFKNTANGWARDARRRAQNSNKDRSSNNGPFHLQQKARSRQSRPPWVVSASSWGPTAQPQREWSQHPLCRRCGSLLHPGLRTCRSCGASSARAPGRTLRAAAFIILLLCLFVLAVARRYTRPPGPRRSMARPQLPASSPGTRLPQLAGAVAPPRPGQDSRSISFQGDILMTTTSDHTPRPMPCRQACAWSPAPTPAPPSTCPWARP